MTGRNCEAVAREQPHRKRDMDIASYLRINDLAGLGITSVLVLEAVKSSNTSPAWACRQKVSRVLLLSLYSHNKAYFCPIGGAQCLVFTSSISTVPVSSCTFICVYHINLFAAEWEIELSQLMHSAWLKRSSKTLY